MSDIILDENSNVGERVRFYRKKRNITQKQLAQWVGVSTNLIIKLEKHNQQPASDIMMLIALELEMPFTYVFRGGSHKMLMYEYYPNKTLVLPDGNMKFFGFVQVVADCYIGTDKYICVCEGNKKYLGVLDNAHKFTRLLCSDSDSGVCFICTKQGTQFIREDDGTVVDSPRLIAGIANEITHITVPVIT